MRLLGVALCSTRLVFGVRGFSRPESEPQLNRVGAEIENVGANAFHSIGGSTQAQAGIGQTSIGFGFC
jgi:hypothetical protein